MIPLPLTFILAKASQRLVTRLGKGGGTALPGLLAYSLNKKLVAELGNQLHGSIVVVGTNGKTTTSRMVSTHLEAAGKKIIHNRSGSNMTRGVLSTLIANASWGRKIDAEWGVFEVDEAYFPEIAALLKPKYVVMLNLFRDQLDRYGEVSTLAEKWQKAVGTLSEDSILIFNTDDPQIAGISSRTSGTSVGFGVDVPAKASKGAIDVAAYADSRLCPQCGGNLKFSTVYYSHLGLYACSKCSFARSKPMYSVTHYELDGMSGSTFRVYDTRQTTTFSLRLAGLYNIYNALAAISLARSLEIDYSLIKNRTENFQAAFGRLEEVQLAESKLVLVLVKNPTGFNQVIDALASKPEAYTLWLLLNDNVADGRDVSWVWDVELEKLANITSHTVVGGTRAYDMALRVKYADFAMHDVAIAPSLSEGLRTVSSLKAPVVYCLCTYTAMLSLRSLLQKSRMVQSYHSD